MVLFTGAAVLVGAAVLGGGGYIIRRFFGVVDRAEDVVGGVADDMKEFIFNKVWPVFHNLAYLSAILLLMAIIYCCDQFLNADPRSTAETWLANGVCVFCWIGIVIVILTILLNVLGVTVDKESCMECLGCLGALLVLILFFTFVVFLLSWLLFGDYYFVQTYNFIVPKVIDLVEYLFYRK